MNEIRIIYPLYGGSDVASLEHIPGQPLKMYLKQVRGLMGHRIEGGYCLRNKAGEKVKLTYIPEPGDTIQFQKVAKALS